jgi:putative hydrolase of the HAD superfamily
MKSKHGITATDARRVGNPIVDAMTIKAVMVDVDGVLIVHPDAGGWSTHLERDLGLPSAQLQAEFFKPHWDDVIHGRASLRDRLAPALKIIAAHLSVDALIDYWFRNDAHVNKDLLAELATIRAEGIQIHLATVQEHERARFLWEDLDFRSSFDGLHYAADLSCSKPDAKFYKQIESRTGFDPQDLFFIDDKIANVEGALACGWAAALWTGNNRLRSLMRQATDAFAG